MPDSSSTYTIAIGSAADTSGFDRIDTRVENLAAKTEAATAQMTNLQQALLRAEAAGDTDAAAQIDHEIALRKEVEKLARDLGIAEHDAYAIATERLALLAQIAAREEQAAAAAKAAAVAEKQAQEVRARAEEAWQRTQQKLQQESARGQNFGNFAGNFAANLAGNLVTRAQMEISQLADRAFALAGQLDDLSTRSGKTVEALQLIGNAASQDGVQMESVAEALNNLDKARSAAIGGNDRLAKSFADLGVSRDQLASLEGENLFLAMSDGAKNAEDRGRALNATMAILGRSGRALFGTMEKGSQDIRALSEAMGIMSGTTVQQLAGAQEKIEQLQNAVTVWAGKQITAMKLAFDTRAAKGWLGFLDLAAGGTSNLLSEMTRQQNEAGKSLAELGGKAPKAADNLDAWVKKLGEANEKLATFLEQQEKIKDALADEEQQRITGLEKAGLITPEEAGRQKEAASIEAERAKLTRAREAAQSGLMRAAGARADIDDGKVTGDPAEVTKRRAALETEMQARNAEIEELNIRLRTNRGRQGSFENANARADHEAQYARGAERAADEEAGRKRRGEEVERQKKAWEAMTPEERTKRIGADAAGLGKHRAGFGSDYGGGASVTGGLVSKVQEAGKALQDGAQDGERENLVKALQDLLEVGRLQQADRERAQRDLQAMQREIEQLKQQTKNNKAAATRAARPI